MSAATVASRSTPGGRNSAVFTIPIGGGTAFLAFLRVTAGTGAGAGAASLGEAVPASAEAENVRREGTRALVSGGGATARKREGRGRRSIASWRLERAQGRCSTEWRMRTRGWLQLQPASSVPSTVGSAVPLGIRGIGPNGRTNSWAVGEIYLNFLYSRKIGFPKEPIHFRSLNFRKSLFFIPKL